MKDFRLDRQHKLFTGSVFRGLGWMPGSSVMRDGDGQPGYVKSSGTLTNMVPADDCVWVPELGRWATDYDGTDDYVENTSGIGLPTLEADTWTMSVWVKPAVIQDGTIIFNWGNRTSGVTNGSKRSILRHGGAIYFAAHANDLNVDPDWNTGTDLTPSAWNHIIISWIGSANELTGYKDGSTLGSITRNNLTNASESYIQFGGPAVLGWQKQYSGLLADPIILNRVLTPSEIKTLADKSDPMLGGLILPPRRRLWGAVTATNRRRRILLGAAA